MTSSELALTPPIMPTMRLEGRRGLVTGASRGLGFAAAAALAQAGAHVWMCARNQAEIESAAEAVRSFGGKASSICFDVSDLSEASRNIEKFGPFDILVNNAGMNRPHLMVDMTPEDFDAVMSVNVRAAYFAAQAVAKGLIAAGKGGSLITMSSQMGLVGGPRRTVYCASKHAVEGFTKAMAMELGPLGIRVNTICPTFIETPLTKKDLDKPGVRDWVLSKIKLGRLGKVEDIMGAVAFLASDAASLITGASLVVDGGWTAG